MADMEYWQEEPEWWLLEESLMALTPEEFSGFFWILMRCRMGDEGRQVPPGVIPGGDGLETRLEAWSRLRAAAWKRARWAIARMFQIDLFGNLHHADSKRKFLSYQRMCHDKKIVGSRGGKKKRGDVQKSVVIEPFRDPYARFGATFGISWTPPAGQLDRAGDTMPLFSELLQVVPTCPPGGSHVLSAAKHASDRSIDRIDRSIHGAAPPLPLGEAASPGRDPDIPPPPPPAPPMLPRAVVLPHKINRLSAEEFEAQRQRQFAALEGINGHVLTETPKENS